MWRAVFKFFGVFVLLGLFLVSNSAAQIEADKADDLFRKYRAAEVRFGIDVRDALDGRKRPDGEPCGGWSGIGGAIMGVCSSAQEEMFRIKEQLKNRADADDATAMFYTALLQVEFAELVGKSFSKGDALREYESAASYYKRAGDGGAIGGYWNVALMYSNGTGVTQSKLAAAEWFYKAGMAYVASGLREKALAALEAIQAIDKEHPLGKRLQTALKKGEPK